MLHSKVDPVKSYEELLKEAISQIPIYSEQWTNFNPSDPGITILENLTAFQVLQQQSIDEVSEKTRRNLLKLVGFQAMENAASKIPLQMPPDAEDVTLPAHKKMMVGGMVFETGKPIRLRKSNLLGVYRLEKKELSDVTPLLNHKLPMSVPPFGEDCREGDGLYFAFSQLPPVGKALTLYIQTEDRWSRNQWSGEDIPPFATISWQVWTVNGWENVKALDKTGYFVQNGKITLVMPESQVATGVDQLEGYVIRAILEKSDYDIPPLIHAVFDNVFEVRQRNTLAASFAKGGNRVTIRSAMVNDLLYQVLVREEGEDCYRLYREAGALVTQGRFFRVKQAKPGRLVLDFDANTFGFGPAAGADSVRVVCYTTESVNWRSIGKVYGYDDQVIDMANVAKVVPEGFQIMAEQQVPGQPSKFYFCPPNATDESALGYTIHSESGEIEIYNPGLGGVCDLYLTDCAVTLGHEGNLRGGNTLTTKPRVETGELPISFLSLGCGTGGTSYESTQALCRRFSRSLMSPKVAVTAKDYARIVLETPGLCLESAKAAESPAENLVVVAVKPKSNQPFPMLSPLYLEQIQKHLNETRLITTRVVVTQPKYVPVHLQVKVQISSTAQSRQERLAEKLRAVCGDLINHGKLGETLSFQKLYQAVQGLEDVEYLYEITPRSGDPAAVTFDGTSLHLQPNCIVYLGDVQMQLIW